METNNILDVTLIEPKLKHPTIFQKFDELKEGESFTIKNDHNPKPLHYQLLAEKGKIFDFIYEEKGPEVWIVKITKKILKTNIIGSSSVHDLKIDMSAKVGDIVAEDPAKIDIFKKYGIDFCCGGDKTLKEVCVLANIDEEIFKNELLNEESLNLDKTSGHNERYNDWSISFLIDYIIFIHHTFARRQIPEITEYLDKIANVHKSHLELKIINELFIKAASTLLFHLDKEEKDLFKHIKDLEGLKGTELNTLTVAEEIKEAINDHEYVGEIFKKIESLSSNFLIPEDACASYSYTFKLLKEFYDDIRMHIHLENNILFKKVLNLEVL
jgi:regulator of cell morphogenesis and NO signaling